MPTIPQDGKNPLQPQQWHLTALGADLPRLLSEFDGTGVLTAVYDDGLDPRHPDLAARYDASKQVVVGGVRIDPSNGIGVHGTAAAGLIGAAANNGIGGIGVAPSVHLVGVDVHNGPGSGAGTIEAIKGMGTFDSVVYNGTASAAFGDAVLAGVDRSSDIRLALSSVVAGGRNGFGTIVLVGSGDGGTSGPRDANASLFSQARETITIGALDRDGDVSSTSARGSSLLVSAPGSQLVTTDLPGTRGMASGDYTTAFGGTAAAAAVATGVVDLMLDANAGLGWRDVQSILAITADKAVTATGVEGIGKPLTFRTNKADNVDGGGMSYSNEAGFGRIDAFEAVRFAEVWGKFGPPRTSSNEVSAAGSSSGEKPIADLGTTNVSIAIDNSIMVSHVDVTLKLTHQNINDLRVELVSPEGTTSTLLSPTSVGRLQKGEWTWSLGSEAFMGETSMGRWDVRITDTKTGSTGILHSARVDVYGDAPSANDVHHFTNAYFEARAKDQSRGTVVDTNGGTDWINLAGMTGNLSVDLRSGGNTSISGSTGVLFTIDARTTIENVVTGDGNDVVRGNAVANRLSGMRGNDTFYGDAGADIIDGGQGVDTVIYAGSETFVDIDLGRQKQLGGLAEGDQLIAIENVVGTAYADRLFGNASANRLDGGAGNDYLNGGAGADVLIGGTGSDTVSYAKSTAAVKIDLARPIQEGGHAQGDTLSGIEIVVGSSYGDTLSGTQGFDTLSGGAGADRLDGRQGDDHLGGGAGADVLIGGEGYDTAFYDASTAGVTVDLLTGKGMGGDAEGDVLSGIEMIVGSAYGDRLTGSSIQSSAQEKLAGGAGNDILAGLGGGDFLDGGVGIDTATYAASKAGVNVDLSTGKGFGGDAEGDLVFNIEYLTGSAYGDKLTGDGAGNRLDGGAGNDLLSGGAGNDVLIGGVGADVLTGGAGADVFVFAKGFGKDRITDFVSGVDRIDLRAFHIDASDVTLTKTSSGDYVELGFAIPGVADTILLSPAVKIGDILFA